MINLLENDKHLNLITNNNNQALYNELIQESSAVNRWVEQFLSDYGQISAHIKSDLNFLQKNIEGERFNQEGWDKILPRIQNKNDSINKLVVVLKLFITENANKVLENENIGEYIAHFEKEIQKIAA